MPIESLNEAHGDYRLKIKINEIIDVLNAEDEGVPGPEGPAGPAGADGADGSTFTPMEHQDDSTAPSVTILKADFNALLAKLQASGLML
jgi:hypothetical protein